MIARVIEQASEILPQSGKDAQMTYESHSTLTRNRLRRAMLASRANRTSLAFTVVTTSFRNLATFDSIEEAEEFATNWMGEFNPVAGHVYIQDNSSGVMTEFGMVSNDDVIRESFTHCARENCNSCQAGLNAEFIARAEKLRDEEKFVANIGAEHWRYADYPLIDFN